MDKGTTPTAIYTQYTHNSMLIHTLNKTPVFNKAWSYRPELCRCVRG